jgi:hypothetical protein
MSKNPPYRKLFAILAFAGGLASLGLAWLPVRVSISHFIVEDMFYYLQAARHVLAGDGASLDGTHLTNGFHPLWMLLCCAFDWMAGGEKELSVHLALTGCATFFILTACALYRCAKATCAAVFALPMAAFFLFNYRLMCVPLGGLETSINGFCIALVTLFMVEKGRIDSTKSAALFGTLLGLTILSRMDAFLLAAIVLGWVILCPRHQTVSSCAEGEQIAPPPAHEGGRTSSPTSKMGTSSGLALATSIAFVLLVPWFVFSLHTSGTLLPNSRQAIKAWSGVGWNSELGLLSNTTHLAKDRLGRFIEPANDVGNLFGFWPMTAPSEGRLRFVGAALFAIAVLFLVLLLWRARRAEALRNLGWIPLYVLAHTGYYILFGRVTIRYLYPPIIPLFVFVAAALGARHARSPSPSEFLKKTLLVLLVLMGGAALAGLDAYRRGYASERWHLMHAGLYEDLAPWIKTHTPDSARVGSFNAGILSYHCGRPVVNLDGVMNDSAIPALQSKTLAMYIDQEDIDYLADLESEIEKFMDKLGGDPNWQRNWKVVHQASHSYGGGIGHKNLVVMERSILGSNMIHP